ncbi:DNA polymerase IV [soil metagenome]
MPLRSLFLDMNAFFASCEQQDRPELRGLPLVVAPVLADSSCCIAASYEAKAFGIKTGTSLADAKRMCPGVTIVEARTELYVRTHHAVRAAVDTVMPIERVLSVDEFVGRLDPSERPRAAAAALAGKIKAALRTHVGEFVRCSIGIASTALLAKMASDMQKLDGLTIIEDDDLPGMLAALELRDVPGIAAKMEARLHAAGVCTLPEFVALSAAQARAAWGSCVGEDYWNWLRGNAAGEHRPTIKRQIGHQHVLAPALRVEPFTRQVAIKLLVRAAARLRQEGYVCRGMHLGIDMINAPAWRVERSVAETDDTATLVEVLAETWRQRPPGRVLRVDVILIGLIHRGAAAVGLFPEAARRRRLSAALDQINVRFGDFTVIPCAMQQVGEAAPRRIAFGIGLDRLAPLAQVAPPRPKKHVMGRITAATGIQAGQPLKKLLKKQL